MGCLAHLNFFLLSKCLEQFSVVFIVVKWWLLIWNFSITKYFRYIHKALVIMLLSGPQSIWIPKKDSLVITEMVIYILHRAQSRSVDGAGAVTPSVAWLKDLFGGLCCRSRTAHTVGALLCLPSWCHGFYYNYYLRDQEMLTMACRKNKSFFFEFMMKTSRIDCTLHLEQQTLFSLKKMSCFSVTFHREGKTFFLLLSWELWVANK